jgi:hypothetical protein
MNIWVAAQILNVSAGPVYRHLDGSAKKGLNPYEMVSL